MVGLGDWGVGSVCVRDGGGGWEEGWSCVCEWMHAGGGEGGWLCSGLVHPAWCGLVFGAL